MLAVPSGSWREQQPPGWVDGQRAPHGAECGRSRRRWRQGQAETDPETPESPQPRVERAQQEEEKEEEENC